MDGDRNRLAITDGFDKRARRIANRFEDIPHRATETTMNLYQNDPQCQDGNTSALEEGAREAMASVIGKPLTDAEWVPLRARLLSFATILCDWERAAKVRKSRAANVMMLEEERTRDSGLAKAA